MRLLIVLIQILEIFAQKIWFQHQLHLYQYHHLIHRYHIDHHHHLHLRPTRPPPPSTPRPSRPPPPSTPAPTRPPPPSTPRPSSYMTPNTNTINFQNTTTSTSQLSSINIPTSPPLLSRMNATILNPPNRPPGISNSRSVSKIHF